MNQNEVINQLLSAFSFCGMEIKLNIRKNDKGLEISGTIMPQNSDSNNPEKPETELPDACVQEQFTPPVAPEYDYTVRAIKPSGKASQLLELVDRSGEAVTAYIKAGDQSISAGSCLREVEMTQKTGAYGEYNIIYAYELAA